MRKLDYKVLTVPEELQSIAMEWQSLWSSSTNPSLFSSPDWLLPWIETYWQETWQLRTLVGLEDGELRLIIPMYVQRPRFRGTPAIAYPLGQGEPEYMEVCSEFQEILISPGFESNATESIVNWLMRLEADAISWKGLPDGGQTSMILSKLGIIEKRRTLRYRLDSSNWSVDLLGKNSRIRWRRIQRKIENLGGKFHYVEGREQDKLWTSLARLHQDRWVSKGEHGAFRAPQFSRFHALFRQATNYEQSRISCLEIAGKPVAINYFLVGLDTLFFYQSGWDTAYKNLSPGFALHVWSNMNNEKKYYDFMQGPLSGSYKQDFKGQEIPILNLVVSRTPASFRLKALWRRLRYLRLCTRVNLVG